MPRALNNELECSSNLAKFIHSKVSRLPFFPNELSRQRELVRNISCMNYFPRRFNVCFRGHGVILFRNYRSRTWVRG